ncbi:MAG: hypothetical protein RIA63_04010 [Cyclobacteriaceae bacterium]
MIKLFRPLWIVALIVVAFACKEDDPLPIPTVDFINGTVEVGVETMFDNLTTNADNYQWIFRQNSSELLTTTEISPSVSFDTPGDVEVVLKAFTKDGQVDSINRTITVRQRFLTGYVVNIYPTKNGSDDWDPGLAPEEVFPDIFVQLIATDATTGDNALFDGLLGNVDVSTFGRGEGSPGYQTESVILTNEDWGFALFDFDPDDPATTTVNEEDYVFMDGATFNPVQGLTFKFPDGTGGLISIFFNDGTFDIDLYYELR